jgi:UDP-N-acetylmuramate dehydrogenase
MRYEQKLISEIHPNFLINYNNASSDDIENLIAEIKKRVLQKFNIDLHLELKIVGI